MLSGLKDGSVKLKFKKLNFQLNGYPSIAKPINVFTSSDSAIIYCSIKCLGSSNFFNAFETVSIEPWLMATILLLSSSTVNCFFMLYLYDQSTGSRTPPVWWLDRVPNTMLLVRVLDC